MRKKECVYDKEMDFGRWLLGVVGRKNGSNEV